MDETKKKKLITDLAVLLVFTAVSVLYAYAIGLLYCGYYFADDHEIARMHGSIVREGFFGALSSWLSADMRLRFRPVYWIFRISESLVFGTHVKAWHLMKAIEIGGVCWLSYLYARRRKAGFVSALIFGVIWIFGSQCAVIYRLGPQEPLALIFFWLALLSADEAAFIEVLENAGMERKRKRLLTMSFYLFLALMALTKESFLVLLPAFVLYRLYAEQKNDESFFAVLLRNAGSVIYGAVLFLTGMGIIVFYSGTSSTGYAGVDESYGVPDYLKGMWNICKGELSGYLIVLLFCLIVNIVLTLRIVGDKKSEKSKTRDFLRKRIYEFVILFYAVFIQVLLHAKSGMSERYLIPAITWIFIYVFCFSFPLWRAYFYKAVPAILAAGWLCFLAVTGNVHALCLDYVYVCSNNTLMLLRLNELAETYGKEDCKIIVCANYGEWNLAISAFMEELYGVDEVYSLSTADPYNDISEDRYLIGDETDRTLTIPEADIYVTQSEFLTIKMQDHQVDYTQMQKDIFATYIVYSR